LESRIEHRISYNYLAAPKRFFKLINKEINKFFVIANNALSGDNLIIAHRQFNGPSDLNLFGSINHYFSRENHERHCNYSLICFTGLERSSVKINIGKSKLKKCAKGYDRLTPGKSLRAMRIGPKATRGLDDGVVDEELTI